MSSDKNYKKPQKNPEKQKNQTKQKRKLKQKKFRVKTPPTSRKGRGISYTKRIEPDFG